VGWNCLQLNVKLGWFCCYKLGYNCLLLNELVWKNGWYLVRWFYFTWAVYVKFSGLVLLVQKKTHPDDDVINCQVTCHVIVHVAPTSSSMQQPCHRPRSSHVIVHVENHVIVHVAATSSSLSTAIRDDFILSRTMSYGLGYMGLGLHRDGPDTSRIATFNKGTSRDLINDAHSTTKM
jgi:hypothetical protein